MTNVQVILTVWGVFFILALVFNYSAHKGNRI